jgi:hypothetical protein
VSANTQKGRSTPHPSSDESQLPGKSDIVG